MPKLNPGEVIKVRPESKHFGYALVIIVDDLAILKKGGYPEKKQIPENEIGFIVSAPPPDESMFDWLIEVAFPSFGLQGWIQKTDIISVNL